MALSGYVVAWMEERDTNYKSHFLLLYFLRILFSSHPAHRRSVPHTGPHLFHCREKRCTRYTALFCEHWIWNRQMGRRKCWNPSLQCEPSMCFRVWWGEEESNLFAWCKSDTNTILLRPPHRRVVWTGNEIHTFVIGWKNAIFV